MGAVGGGWVCEPILVLSFGLSQAEQQILKSWHLTRAFPNSASQVLLEYRASFCSNENFDTNKFCLLGHTFFFLKCMITKIIEWKLNCVHEYWSKIQLSKKKSKFHFLLVKCLRKWT